MLTGDSQPSSVIIQISEEARQELLFELMCRKWTGNLGGTLDQFVTMFLRAVENKQEILVLDKLNLSEEPSK